MARAWLDERLRDLLPALQALTVAQEDDIARLCEEELAAWRSRPEITKPGSLRPVLTAARKAIKQLPLTVANRYKNPRTGEYEHVALKYLNFSAEEWEALNAVSEEKLQARLEQQQLIENPQAIVARAEKLLASSRWDDLVTGLAVVTGRRLTELLKTGRFFPKTLSTVIFDGQLKRRDVNLKPYEIPVLTSAELVISAWRRLRHLEDCTGLDNEQVAQKYHKAASENAARQFAGLIPQKSATEDLHTHTLRATYAHIAVLWFCPLPVSDRSYVNAILGHWQATNDQQMRQFAATDHYYDYTIGDGSGQVDGRRGIRLDQPGVQVLEVFQRQAKGAQEMTDTTVASEQPVLETKAGKTRGVLTTKPGTFDQAMRLMEQRGMRRHDEIVMDLMAHDAVAHQMYALLDPLAAELHSDGPISTLQALIAAYHAGGTGAQAEALAGLLREVADEKEPVEYLRMLVERDRNFHAALAGRHAGTDYSALSLAQLSNIKTPEAATERFKRAIDAILKHNEAQTDRLHLWYINAAAVRDLVGGRNDAVMAYVESRQQEIDAHHKRYGLTPRQNSKPIAIEDEVIIEPGWKKPVGKLRGKKQEDQTEDE
jgi:hypothetical protein